MKQWEKVKLGQLLKESRIESINPDTSRRIRVKLNVGGIEKRPDTNDKEGATKYFTRKKGQFIYGRQNLHKGAFGIIPDELDGFDSSADIPAFDVDNACYPEWIFYYFKQGNFYLNLETLAKGVGSKRIHPEQLFELYIPLPTKEEQREILDKVKDFEDNHRIVSEEINTQLTLLTALRQSILTEAIQGQLTAQWRKDNPNQEHASELLKRIATEKAQLIKEKKIGKEKPLPAIKEEEAPFEAPEGWVWCRLGDIVQVGTGSTPSKANPAFYSGNVPWYTSSATGDLFAKPPEQFISELALKETNCKVFPAGSLIVAMYGQGKTRGQVSELVLAGATNQALAAMVFFETSNPSKSYVKYYFRKIYHEIRELAEGGAQPNLNVLKIKSTLIPLPPLPEQHAIVQKVNTLMAYCDELEQQVKQSKADLDLLMQAVLSEVFGAENQAVSSKPVKTKLSGKETLMLDDAIQPIYEGNTLNMELLEILQQQGGKIAAVNLWKMSKYQKDIDAFYEALKKEVEEKKTIKEAEEKGWLELVAP